MFTSDIDTTDIDQPRQRHPPKRLIEHQEPRAFSSAAVNHHEFDDNQPFPRHPEDFVENEEASSDTNCSATPSRLTLPPLPSRLQYSTPTPTANPTPTPTSTDSGRFKPQLGGLVDEAKNYFRQNGIEFGSIEGESSKNYTKRSKVYFLSAL